MAGYVTVNRLSIIQLRTEERKQQAHLKKIAEMQRRSGLDNGKPARFPHIRRSFNQKHKQNDTEIQKENFGQVKRLIDIMQSKSSFPPAPPYQLPNTKIRRLTLRSSKNNDDHVERVSKVKGMYDKHDWQKDFEEHKAHLRISKDNKLFTPRDIGVNRQRVIAMSTKTSRRSTISSSTANMQHAPASNA